MGGGPNWQRFIGTQHLARNVVDFRDLLYLIAPELHADRVVRIGWEHIQSIAAHAERAALQLVVVSVVLDVDELVDKLIAVLLNLLVQEHGHAGVFHWGADAVDAGDGCHHDNVTARKQLRGSRMTQFLHLFVDGGVLLDERVGGGNVCFRLVVVVVRHEVHHRVVREELLQLGGKLGGKRLVRGKHQRGLLNRFDGFRHGVGLARTGNAQKRFITHALLDVAGKLGYGLRLVARRLVGGNHLERLRRKARNRKLAFHLVTLKAP